MFFFVSSLSIFILFLNSFFSNKMDFEFIFFNLSNYLQKFQEPRSKFGFQRSFSNSKIIQNLTCNSISWGWFLKIKKKVFLQISRKRSFFFSEMSEQKFERFFTRNRINLSFRAENCEFSVVKSNKDFKFSRNANKVDQ